MGLEIVFPVEFKRILLENQPQGFSEGEGRYGGVFPVEVLICFAYCVDPLPLRDICVQAGDI